MIDLDKLAELARAAAPGPWFAWFAEVGKWTIQVAAGWLFESSAHGTKADAAFIAAANPTAVLELLERVRAAEAAVQLGASKLIHDQAFMAKLVDEHEKKYGDEKNVIMRAIVRELAAREPRGSEPHECGPCGASEREEHEPSCPYRRAVEATKS